MTLSSEAVTDSAVKLCTSFIVELVTCSSRQLSPLGWRMSRDQLGNPELPQSTHMLEHQRLSKPFRLVIAMQSPDINASLQPQLVVDTHNEVHLVPRQPP